VIGAGKHLFEEGTGQVPLKLLESQPLSTGVVALRYTPASWPPQPQDTPRRGWRPTGPASLGFGDDPRIRGLWRGMQRSVVIARTRRGGAGAWWSRLPAPFQPASSGPVRYWQDRGRVAAKCALAAMAAWTLARYAAGQQDPYFAPLAALLGVSPTVARSVREGLQYVAGFVLGAVLAIPAALVLGPSIAGIAVVVLAGVVMGSWRRLGGQSTQVTFTALFVLLIGGYQPLHYLTPRLIDVGIGVIIGLAVNVLVFPPYLPAHRPRLAVGRPDRRRLPPPARRLRLTSPYRVLTITGRRQPAHQQRRCPHRGIIPALATARTQTAPAHSHPPTRKQDQIRRVAGGSEAA
jgi:hypothetical protein